MKRLLASLFSLSILLFGCNNDYVYDSQAPEVNFRMPEEGAVYTSGMPLNVIIDISDDVFLDEFEFRLRGPENFPAAWDTTLTYNLYGESSELLLDFTIPFGLPSGKYNLTCTAFDKKTRETESKTGIFIQNSFDASPPMISLDNDTINTFTGSAFVRVSGTIEDDDNIKTVRFELWDTSTETMLELVEHTVNTTSYEINEFLNNPLVGQYGESGQYDIYVKAFDDALNLDERKIVLFVQ